MIHHTKKEGFTIVELMLALSFIAFILLFTVFATVQVMRNYSKGIAIKEINQTARDMTDDMIRVIRSANSQTVNLSKLNAGRACLGGVSYVWNTQGGNANLYTDGTAVTVARVGDPAGAMCQASPPAVNKNNSTAVLSDRIWVQNISFTQSADKNLMTVSVRLSTSGQNAPTFNDPAQGLICSGDAAGQYCSVTTFSTTVATRNGGQ